ncbi:MAG: DNA-processing protein DprA [Cytophagales bacterium]
MRNDAEEILSLLALLHIPGIGDLTAKLLCNHFGSAKKALYAPKGKLLGIHGIGANTAQAIFDQQKEAVDKANKQLVLCEKHNVEIVSFFSSEYPELLKKNTDAPTILYAKGNLNVLKKEKMVAVVGTRSATTYGKKITEEICKELVANDICVVSGLAYGIDIVAHKSTLQAEGETIAVLGGG